MFIIAISVDPAMVIFSGLKKHRQTVVLVGVDALVVVVVVVLMAATAVFDDGDLDGPAIVTVGEGGFGELHRRRQVERKVGGSDSEEDNLCSALI